MSQSMRFRLFINQAEGKMWAIGVDAVDFESNQRGSWMTMWGPLEEVDTTKGFRYYFSRKGNTKPIDVATIRRCIHSKNAAGYREKHGLKKDEWEFVPDTKMGILKVLALESDLQSAKLSPFPVTGGPIVFHDGSTWMQPNADDLDSAGYAPIGF